MGSKVRLTVKELTGQAYSARNFFSNVKPDDGKFLAASFCFRGSMTTQEVDSQMDALQTDKGDDFVEWIPNNIKSSIVVTAPQEASRDLPLNSERCTEERPSSIGTREKVWTRWSSRKLTRTCEILSLNTRTNKMQSTQKTKMSRVMTTTFKL